MVSKRAKVNRELGRRGGLATARKHGADFLENRSSKAGTATKNKYGPQFYRYLASLRPAGTRSAKARVNKLIKDILPEANSDLNSLELMQAAAKTLQG